MNIQDFMKEKTYTKFCHYTSVSNARCILSNDSALFLNKLEKMNDLDELGIHESDKDKVFLLSFCHSEAMDIPLFYLYGGIDGKGCRIEFTHKKICQLIQGDLVPVNKRNKMLKKKYLKLDYDVYVGWVHYVASNGIEFYRNTIIDGGFNSFEKAIDNLEARNESYFVKKFFWKYEKEFRIVVKFKYDVPYDRVALKFPVDNNEKGISLMCGPELETSDMQEIKDEFYEYGIRKIQKFDNINIKMDLNNK